MEIEELLRARDLRMTRPRQCVWDVLQGATGHLSASEIAGQVAEIDPRINVSSVYRTLALFDELGVVRESHLGEGHASQWELTHDDTVIHIVCRDCDTVMHHAAEPVRQLRTYLDDAGFAPSVIDVRVAGICQSCAP